MITAEHSAPRERRQGPPAPLLEVRNLAKHFRIRGSRRRHLLRALDDVSFAVQPGEILGIVGESGCGKSTLGKTLIGIQSPSAGAIFFQGQEIGHLSAAGYRPVRREMQYVYQDSGGSLDPRWTVGRSLDEPLVIHGVGARAERRRRVEASLRAVGLREEHLHLYPHELSGGQQRRVGLARILTLGPKLIILDEPTSGLDVSVQATILKLLRQLWQEFGLTFLFISHDLGVIRMMCTRVAVMYLGRIVELGNTREVFQAPHHPYTRSLLAAVPRPGGPRVVEAAWLEGEPPDPMNIPDGCRFRNRCPMAADVCAREDPAFLPVGPAQAAACHFARPATGQRNSERKDVTS